MGRSTHSDRTAAWAAKEKNPGYRSRKIIPSADEVNALANDSSVIESEKQHNKIETAQKED